MMPDDGGNVQSDQPCLKEPHRQCSPLYSNYIPFVLILGTAMPSCLLGYFYLLMPHHPIAPTDTLKHF